MTAARSALALALVAIAGAIGIATSAEDDPAPQPTPVEAQASDPVPESERAAISATLALIDAGEPLPYDEDGQTFQNREGLLPERPPGYYREYTVETPGSPDRGARRLVIGEAGETWYTNDHYSSFTAIDPGEYR